MKTLISTFLLTLTFTIGFAQNKEDVRLALKQRMESAKDDTAKVNLLENLMWSYMFIYPDTAIVYAKQALELSKKINYKIGESKSLAEMCLALTLLGNFTPALNYGFDNLALCEKLKDSSLLTFAHINLLICYREQEDYEEALKYGYRALNFSKGSKADFFSLPSDLGLKPDVLGMISSVYERNNQLDSALYYGLETEKLTQKWSGIYLTLGNIYLKLKQRDVAFKYYKKGIRLAEENLIYIDLVDIYNKMSIEYELAGKRDSSIYYAQKSISIEGVHSYPEGELRASKQLAHLYEIQGKKDSTIHYLKLSETLRNNLMNRQKTRDAQSLAFNEQLNTQKLLAQSQENQNKIKMSVLLVVVLAALMVAFILWRNNKQKQQANTVLEKTLSELKSTQTQLIQKEKLASLGELTAGIAHEIQNPLNFVNNFSELSVDLVKDLKEEIEKTTQDKEYIGELFDDLSQNQEKINHHGKRASSIVKGMLEHSRASTGVKELTDINKLADEYLRLSYHGLRAKDKEFNADFTTEFDENLPKIEVIPQDIGRVLLNLINNAFYAVNEKKKQNIDGGYKPTVSASTQQLDNQIIIKVKDNGTGMPESVRAKVFQPFFTTKPTGQGTGLGLSLAYDIVTKGHGGALEVLSTEGAGSEFIITLPFKSN